MIVYGTNSHESETRLKTACRKCGQPALVQSDWQRYFHIMFIPTFPIGKSRVVHCGVCRDSYETKGSTPLWTFIGSGLLAGCFLFGLGRQAFAAHPVGLEANTAELGSEASAPPAPPSASAAPHPVAAPRPASHAGAPAPSASAAHRRH